VLYFCLLILSIQSLPDSCVHKMILICSFQAKLYNATFVDRVPTFEPVAIFFLIQWGRHAIEGDHNC
jgi:hypothetical protein